jgi:hypothetical protein
MSWDKVPFKEIKINSGALIAVISGIVLNEILFYLVVLSNLHTLHLVTVPTSLMS